MKNNCRDEEEKLLLKEGGCSCAVMEDIVGCLRRQQMQLWKMVLHHSEAVLLDGEKPFFFPHDDDVVKRRGTSALTRRGKGKAMFTIRRFII